MPQSIEQCRRLIFICPKRFEFMKLKSFLTVCLTLFIIANIFPAPKFYLRLNQVGYLPGDIKSGVIISENEIPYQKFFIRNSGNGKTVYEGSIIKSKLNYGGFKYGYTFDFSDFRLPGSYFVVIGNEKSFPFKIGVDVFTPVVDSLMVFFRIQRCGPTHPYLHDKCHLQDATKITGFSDSSAYDVTGGWHDAGDYIKFFSTTALTTYMLLFSYQFDKEKFGFDSDNNNVPDILEEARIGLDWLLRSNFNDTFFITQVQDERDHKVGWRMPEDDSLEFDRPGFAGIGKNQIGIFSAVMSLASVIWNERFLDDEFANRCLSAAVQKFSVIDEVVDIDTMPEFYKDKNYLGKLALGAIELYNATGNNDYLNYAVQFGDSAGSDYWWSWGDVNALAHYKLAKVVPRFSGYIKNSLIHFNSVKDSSLFNEPGDYSWGSVISFLGSALQGILYKDLTRSNQFDSLITLQRDYVLGRNPWGVSFITKTGSNYPIKPHHQIAYFYKSGVPGAVVGGPVNISLYKDYNIESSSGKFALFNSSEIVYNDDWDDYLTNEATIFGNATALFLFGWFSNRK